MAVKKSTQLHQKDSKKDIQTGDIDGWTKWWAAVNLLELHWWGKKRWRKKKRTLKKWYKIHWKFHVVDACECALFAILSHLSHLFSHHSAYVITYNTCILATVGLCAVATSQRFVNDNKINWNISKFGVCHHVSSIRWWVFAMRVCIMCKEAHFPVSIWWLCVITGSIYKYYYTKNYTCIFIWSGTCKCWAARSSNIYGIKNRLKWNWIVNTTFKIRWYVDWIFLFLLEWTLRKNQNCKYNYIVSRHFDFHFKHIFYEFISNSR